MAELLEFETERLHLRQWRESDFEPFATLNADPQVMEFFPEPLSRQASNEVADKIRSLIERRGWGFWASEAAFGSLNVAFQRLELPEIVSFTTVGNRRSRRVMERIGMQYSGEFVHPSLPEDSLLQPHVLYRLRREQWDVKA